MFDCRRSELICLHWKDIFHSVKNVAGLQAGMTVSLQRTCDFLQLLNSPVLT